MGQENSKLRYESYGVPENLVKLVKRLAVVLVLCGVLLFFISSKLYGDMKVTYRWIGVFALAFGGILLISPTMFMKKYENAMLKIYEDRVEGMSYSPDVYFTVKFEEIYDVKKHQCLDRICW